MSVSGVNKAGVDWLKIDRWLEDQIALAHNEMEGGLTLEEYHRVVGKVQIIKSLKEWVSPTIPPVTTEDDYGLSDNSDGKY